MPVKPSLVLTTMLSGSAFLGCANPPQSVHSNTNTNTDTDSDDGIAISSALALSAPTIEAGQTLTGTVTYTNTSSSPIALDAAAIAARPPGGTHAGGPFLDLQPYAPATTLGPGESLTVAASRAFAAGDATGSWDLYPTYEDGDGVWHDGPDVSLTVGNGTTTGTGAFRVANGQILDPNGNPFRARGIDINYDQLGDASQDASGAPLTSLFPGINFIRVASSGYPDASAYQTAVAQLTALGIVVEIEDHPWPLAAPYTGGQLQDESSWYASLAAAFRDNPYVWFGSMNEPQTDYGSPEAAISDQEVATYGAIRGTGSTTIIMMSLLGGGNPGTIGDGFGMTASSYTAMTGIAWDFHHYGWASNYSTDQNVENDAVLGSAAGGYGIAAAQTIQSADGLVPVVIGEYGNSTTGEDVDPNGDQVLQAVWNSGVGAVAWAWHASDSPGDLLVNDDSTLTSYGDQIAGFIAGN